jgi:hypothetical protein
VRAFHPAVAAGKKNTQSGGHGPNLAFAAQGEYTDFSL